jgi:hypothetical protein
MKAKLWLMLQMHVDHMLQVWAKVVMAIIIRNQIGIALFVERTITLWTIVIASMDFPQIMAEMLVLTTLQQKNKTMMIARVTKGMEMRILASPKINMRD